MKLFLTLTLSFLTIYGIKTAIDNHWAIKSNKTCIEVYNRSLVVDDYLEDLTMQVDYLPKYKW